MPLGLSFVLGVLGAIALTLSTAFSLVTRAVAGAMLMLAVGCGGAQVSAYAAVSAACSAQERFIVERDGTTYEQDATDIAATRGVCDAVLARIESEDPQ
jgi:hypothetical protein